MPHRGLTNLIGWHLQNRIVPAITLQFAPSSFDISFHEIFSTWCSGGTLVVIATEQRRDPSVLLHLIECYQVEKLYLPFVVLQQLADISSSRGFPTSLKEVMTAGEQLKITPSIARFFKATGCTLHNHYGASECQDATTFTLKGDPDTWPILPDVGRPIDNVQVYILDNWLQPTPVGAPGRLYIAGHGLAQGYINRPELNEEKFLSNPFGPGYIYNTGDLACYRSNGDIQYLGRSDRQVKIRGFRIELGEVEGILAKHSQVRGNAVLLREDNLGDKRLVAYVVPASESIDSEQLVPSLRGYLRGSLPEYMMPSHIVCLTQLPVTPTGKVDYRALPVPTQVQHSSNGTTALPASEMETYLASVWKDVLRLSSIGVHDNFFDLGGNSLLLVQVYQQLSEFTERGLNVVDLFQHPTVSSLSRYLNQNSKRDGDEHSSTEAMRSHRSSRHSSVQKRRQLRKQRRNLGNQDG